jgi:hypothetical protein
MPTSLGDLPAELVETVISFVDPKAILVLRQTCQDLKDLSARRFEYLYFRHRTFSLGPQELHTLLEIANNVHLAKSLMYLRITIANRSDQRRWERNMLGYLDHPEQIEELRTLLQCIAKLPRLLEFSVHCQMNSIYSYLNLEKTTRFVLAVCAETGLCIKRLHLDHSVSVFMTRSFPTLSSASHSWDKSQQLSKTVYALTKRIDISLRRYVDGSSEDVDRIKEIVSHFTKLETLSIQLSSTRLEYSEIVGTIAFPAIKALVIGRCSVTPNNLRYLLSSVTESLHVLKFYKVALVADSSWRTIMLWLAENFAHLDNIEFEALAYEHLYGSLEMVYFKPLLPRVCKDETAEPEAHDTGTTWASHNPVRKDWLRLHTRKDQAGKDRIYKATYRGSPADAPGVLEVLAQCVT